jgi:Fe2+ or Zn2+ uptake regulation protein
MASRGRRTRPRRPPSARRAKEVFAIPSAPPREVRVDLVEDPHAHIVCRNCGRIQSLELTELDRHLLTEIARRHPDGWSVERLAFSATGACRRCREGPTAGA